MNPHKVIREKVKHLTDLPNVGPAMAADFVLLGFSIPEDLRGQDPFSLYESLCEKTGVKHDPCVLDVFISVTRFMQGEAPQPWWAYTQERKKILSNKP